MHLFVYCLQDLRSFQHGKPNTEKIFLHPIFAEVLHAACFDGPRSMGMKCKDSFQVAPGEYEMPAPLLALAGTAVSGRSLKRRHC